jgi:4-amino-4-deoxy-L-arabinose transferase-like glycosyltransferase
MSGLVVPAYRRWWARWGWWHWIGLWTLIGLSIRIGSVLGRPDRPPGGDPYYYHYAANLLVDGKGFVNPFLYYGAHRVVPTASFPPGFVFALAAASAVGLKSYFAHRIWCCIIGAAAIVVGGLAGREISGRRAGLIAAFIIAVYPNIWMSDELVISEALSPLLVALVLLSAYRFWKRPGVAAACWLGLSIGVAALVRDELALLGLFVLVPLALLAQPLSWRRRLASLGVGAAAAVLVIGPWVGYNLSRFRDPVFVSSGLGITLASTNCDQVYSGRMEGYWQQTCALAAPIDTRADESVQGAQAESYALHYVRTHESRLGPVLAARLGRAFGLFHPIQQIGYDSHVETRPYHWALVGLAMYYGLALLSVAGVLTLRRRRVPVFPLLAIGVTVALSVMIAFGDTRYRTTFEVSLAILAAVALDDLANRARSRRAAGKDGQGAGRDRPVSSVRAPAAIMRDAASSRTVSRPDENELSAAATTWLTIVAMGPVFGSLLAPVLAAPVVTAATTSLRRLAGRPGIDRRRCKRLVVS